MKLDPNFALPLRPVTVSMEAILLNNPIATDNSIATEIVNEIISIKENVKPRPNIIVENLMRQSVYIQIDVYIWQMYYDDPSG